MARSQRHVARGEMGSMQAGVVGPFPSSPWVLQVDAKVLSQPLAFIHNLLSACENSDDHAFPGTPNKILEYYYTSVSHMKGK